MDDELGSQHMTTRRLDYGLPVSAEREAALDEARAHPAIVENLVETSSEFLEDVFAAIRRQFGRQPPEPGDEERVELFGAMIDRERANPALAESIKQCERVAVSVLLDAVAQHVAGELSIDETDLDPASILFDFFSRLESSDPDGAREVRAWLAEERGESQPSRP